MDMLLSLVQPIQNRLIGMAGAPNMANQRRNSGGRRSLPAAWTFAIWRRARGPPIIKTRGVARKRPIAMPTKQRPVMPCLVS